MMSDTLSDALVSIEHYQTNFPNIYDSHKPKIEEVKAKMTKLREFLDSPESPEWLTKKDLNLESQ